MSAARRLAWGIAVTFVGCAACARGADGPEHGETRVAVVFNEAVPASERVASAYAAARELRASHRIGLDLSADEAIDRRAFERDLLAPLVRWWTETDSRPTYLVLAKGVPLLVEGDTARDGEAASVDSELSRLPALAVGEPTHWPGPLPNPLFARFHPDRRRSVDDEARLKRMCLVTRLDGFTEGDALALIERALRSVGEERPGRVLIDHDGRRGQVDGTRAFRRLASAAVPVPVDFDTAGAFVESASELVGYAGWGSNDTNFVRGARFEWVAGAVAATFVSTSARTVVEPSPGWHPGRARETEREFAGTTQSLTADWIRSGASGAFGYVTEPWLDGCARPDIFFETYLNGAEFGEAAYRALPHVSWRGVVFGDPLMRAPLASR